MKPISVATWNVAWASSRSRRWPAVQERIDEIAADVLVLTEATLDLVPDNGYVAEGGEDWGYASKPSRRKVLVWSRWPITDSANDLVTPGGRHLRALLETPIGTICLHAVCVPWSAAHVSTGRKDRRRWEDHIAFLESLRRLLAVGQNRSDAGGPPVVVAGDINQRGGRKPSGTRAARAAWEAVCVDAGLSVVTDDELIDKVAIGGALAAKLPVAFAPDGLSDHHAVRCQIVPT